MTRPSIRRMLLLLGLIFAGLYLLAGVLVVWGSWVTPFERIRLRKTLADVELIQGMQGNEGKLYDDAVTQATDSLSGCRRHAITEHDDRITMLMEMNLDSAIKEKRIPTPAGSAPNRLKLVQTLRGVDLMTDKLLSEKLK